MPRNCTGRVRKEPPHWTALSERRSAIPAETTEYIAEWFIICDECRDEEQNEETGKLVPVPWREGPFATEAEAERAVRGHLDP